jgi:hypothetical protein
MSNISKSPERGTFHIKTILEKVELGEKTEESAEELIGFYKSWRQQTLELEETDGWKKDNMEYDLRSTQWIIDKVKGDDVYAQNLYASMCNRDFTKNDMWPILTEKRWGCSWRHAGGIIADMQEKGDYIDWYCSGIRDAKDLDDDQFQQLTKEQQEIYLRNKAYVGEGTVTDEIRKDLLKLGWIVLDDEESIV